MLQVDQEDHLDQIDPHHRNLHTWLMAGYISWVFDRVSFVGTSEKLL